MPDTANNIRFNALRSAIYHTSRRSFFESWTRILNFVVVASGTAAAANIAKLFGSENPEIWLSGLAAIAAFAGLIHLVFDPAGLARTHEFLQRRFYEIVAEMAEKTKPTESDLARWEGMLNRLYAEEKPPMRALDAVSYNAALDSLGHSNDQRIPIKTHQSLLKQFFPFNGTAF